MDDVALLKEEIKEKDQDVKAIVVIGVCSIACGVVGAIPGEILPVHFPILMTITSVMGTSVYKIYGRGWLGAVGAGIIASVGSGFLARTLAEELIKFFPGSGTPISVGIAAGGTFVIGLTVRWEAKTGTKLSKEELEEIKQDVMEKFKAMGKVTSQEEIAQTMKEIIHDHFEVDLCDPDHAETVKDIERKLRRAGIKIDICADD